MEAPARRSSQLRRNILLAVVFTIFGLLVAEGILRLVYPQLPSLAALEESDLVMHEFRPSDSWPETSQEAWRFFCGEDSFLAWNGPGEVRYGADEGEALRVWFAGDSVTAGVGVHSSESFPALLGGRLAEATGRPILMRNLGIPGAGFCPVLMQLYEHIRVYGYPDLVVIGFFADDLEDRRMVNAGGRLVAFPARVPNAVLRTLVSHSYLVNLAWYAGISRGDDHGSPFLGEENALRFSQAVPMMVNQLALNDTAVVVAVLAPTGLHFCQPAQNEDSRCSALGPAMDRIAALLGQAEIPFVDLRELWIGKKLMVVPHERNVRRGETGVHPDSAGHHEISEAMWPAIEQALPQN